MQDYWLNTKGKLIPVPDFGHNEYASDLLEKEMGLEGLHLYMDEYKLSYPFEVLHKRGWVRVKGHGYDPKIEILGNCIDLTKPMRNTIDPAMNRVQLRTAAKLCVEFDITLHKAINDKRFW